MNFSVSFLTLLLVQDPIKIILCENCGDDCVTDCLTCRISAVIFVAQEGVLTETVTTRKYLDFLHHLKARVYLLRERQLG